MRGRIGFALLRGCSGGGDFDALGCEGGRCGADVLCNREVWRDVEMDVVDGARKSKTGRRGDARANDRDTRIADMLCCYYTVKKWKCAAIVQWKSE